jgi:hypothetical protein
MEAREYLTLWLKDRDDFIRISDARIGGLKKTGGTRPKKDNRLFTTSYTGMHKIFSRLYGKVDGEQGKYHAMCTVHSCRKYFRTNAARTMHPDLVTNLMRQTGYLDSTYVRKTDAEKQADYKAGEHALYLTRADHRIQGSKLDALQRENAELRAKYDNLEAIGKFFKDDPARAQRFFALLDQQPPAK